MSEDEKKERIQLIATTVEMLLQQVDMFTINFTKEDLDILEEAKEKLENKILHNNSALPLILALGGEYDDTEDRLKTETLEEIINLIKTRVKYKEEKIKRKEQKQNNLKILKEMEL